MRKTRDLCQTCWETAHPGEYAPVAARDGDCVECGAFAGVVRSTVADETNVPKNWAETEAGTAIAREWISRVFGS